MFKSEIGLTRGFHFGTMTLRTTVEYNQVTTLGISVRTSLEYLRQAVTGVAHPARDRRR